MRQVLWGAELTTLEIDAARTAQAKQYAVELKLDRCINFWTGDALEYLSDCKEKYDFILLDAERNAYMEYWKYLPELMNAKGGVLVVDNVISHAAEVKVFMQEVRADSRFATTVLSMGAGLFMVVFKDA